MRIIILCATLLVLPGCFNERELADLEHRAAQAEQMVATLERELDSLAAVARAAGVEVSTEDEARLRQALEAARLAASEAQAQAAHARENSGPDWGSLLGTAAAIAATVGVPGAGIVAAVASKRGERRGREFERAVHAPPPGGET